MAGSLMNSFCDYLAVGLYTKFSALPSFSILQANLFHIGLIIPVQPLFDHYDIFPMPYGAHGQRKLLPLVSK